MFAQTPTTPTNQFSVTQLVRMKSCYLTTAQDEELVQVRNPSDILKLMQRVVFKEAVQYSTVQYMPELTW